MSDPASHATFVIERIYPCAPERVFRAFANATEKQRWFGEGAAHDVVSFASDFRVGGAETLSYRFKSGTPFPGIVATNSETFLDIVPGSRIVTASTMALGGNRISASLVTIELMAGGEGTILLCTHQAAFFPGSDGAAIREAGWRKLFDNLGAHLA